MPVEPHSRQDSLCSVLHNKKKALIVLLTNDPAVRTRGGSVQLCTRWDTVPRFYSNFNFLGN